MELLHRKLHFVASTACALSLGLSSSELAAHGSGDHSHDKKVKIVGGITGKADHQYKADPDWGKMNPGNPMGSTHGGVVLDKAGNVYVSVNGPDSLQVFNKEGKHIKKLAPQARGKHHMQIQFKQGMVTHGP